jgi:hypothetical protein
MSKTIGRALYCDNAIDVLEVIGFEDNIEVVEELSRMIPGCSVMISEGNCDTFRSLRVKLLFMMN